MDVKLLGPPFWLSIHCITFNASIKISEKDQLIYKHFFKSLGDILPCKYCRSSYKVFCKKLRIKHFLSDKMGLTYWLYCIHKLVNLKLNKDNMEFIDVVKKYEKNSTNPMNIDEIHMFVKNTENKYKKYADDKIMKISKEYFTQ